MTANEITLACLVLEQKFGQSAAKIGRVLMETGEMPVKTLYRCTRKPNPVADNKTVERTLHLFFQNDLLLFHHYPDLADDEPYISLDIERIYFQLMEPLVCYAVEEILGDDAAQVLSIVMAMASATADKIIKELEKVKGFANSEAEKSLLQLIRARVVVAWDPALKLDDEACRVDSDAVAKKQSWTKYVVKINRERLYVIYLLYLMQSRVESDPALGAVGCDTFLGLCRASLFSTPRLDFICDEWFQPVTPEDVFRHLSDAAKEGTDLHSVIQNLTALVQHIDGFLLDSGNNSFTMKGSTVLGVWAEHFLYDTIKAEIPQVGLSRAVLQYLIRNPKVYVQAKAIETELFGSAHSLRYAVNELSRLGYIDLMGTSHVAAFEPCRTELFLFVNLPRLYRQKIHYEQCNSLIRNREAMKKQLKDFLDSPDRAGKPGTGTTGSGEPETELSIRERFAKMELGYLEGFLVSGMYIHAAGTIMNEIHSREVYALVEFFNRKPIPDE